MYCSDVVYKTACWETKDTFNLFLSFSYLFPGNSNYAQDLRSPLADVVVNKCPIRKGPSTLARRLYASDFQSNNDEHLGVVKEMGISIINLPDGRVQLLHSLVNVSSLYSAPKQYLSLA